MKSFWKSFASSATAIITAVGISLTAFAAPSYFYRKDSFTNLTAVEKAQVDSAVANVASKVDPSWSTINKLLFVNDYLCSNYEYDTTYQHYHTYDILLGGTSVCQGYAEAFDMIMEKLDIPCHMVWSDEICHAWNIVEVDGNWYHIDVTWNDPVPDTKGAAYHNNFLLSDSGIKATGHSASDWTIYDEPDAFYSAYGNATSTKYDTGAYWSKINTPIVISGQYTYALADTKIQKFNSSGIAVSTIADLSSSKWYTFGSSSSYWIGAFSGFGEHNGRLYYNTPTDIVSIKPDGTDKKVEYTLSSDIKATGSIYGFYISGDNLIFTVSKSPNMGSDDNVRQYMLALPASAVHTHSYTTKVTAPTCTADGYTTYTCSCGYSYKGDIVAKRGHSYRSSVTKAPTCTLSGTRTYTCSVCNDTYTETISRTGHSYVSKVTAPTCTEKGYTTYTCSVCGDSYKGNETATKGHTYTTAVTKNATCTTDGSKTYTCSVCKVTYTDIIAATGHKYVAKTVAPTCTEKGYTTYTCSVCGDSYKALETAAKGHNYSSYSSTSATCTTDGVITYYCSGCGKSYSETIKATGHSMTSSVVLPTDKYQGYTLHTCTKCGYSYKDTFTPSTGNTHEYVVTIIKAATCTTTGVKKYTCKDCGLYYTESIPVTGHTFTDIITAPTCTMGGYTTHYCTGCGYYYSDTATAAKGHSYIAEISNPATCTEAGIKMYVCQGCGSYYSSSVSATGHRYSTKIVAPTCTSKGYTLHSCLNCGASYKDNETAMLPHRYSEKIIAPTCVSKGYKLHTCSACGKSYKDSETAAKGHAFISTITREATCTTSGVRTYTCSVCKESYTDAIAKTGHTYTKKIVAPTTSTEGYTLFTCSMCGLNYKDNFTDKLPLSLSAPTVSFSNVKSNSFTLNWKAVPNAKGYVIEQKINGVWYVKANISNPATTSYTFTGKSQYTNYYYRVKAINGTTNSPYGNVTIKTLLSNPSNLTATTTADSVTLKWTANTKATGYVIEQKINGVWYAKAVIKSGATNIYKFTGKSQLTSYYYRIKATNGSNSSGYTAVTAKTMLSNPANLKATTTSTAITLKWTANTKATGYVIEQKINGVWYAKAVIKSGTTNTYRFTGKSQLTSYYYRVKAVNGTASSAYSNITCKTK